VAELLYSAKALSTLKHFHKMKWVVFVEGRDDVSFWHVVFQWVGFKDYFLKPAGGRPEIDKYQKALIEDAADIAVARDKDLDDLLGAMIDHPRILFTWGYAIENTIFAPPNLANALIGFLRTTVDLKPDIEHWLNEFEDACRPLVVLDLANRLSGSKLDLQLRNSARIMDDRKRHLVSPVKITSLVKKMEASISAGAKKSAEILLSNSSKPTWAHLRGGFICHAILCLVSKLTETHLKRKVNIPYDALFGMAIAGLKLDINKDPDAAHLSTCIKRLASA
jgi:hypothetical protein